MRKTVLLFFVVLFMTVPVMAWPPSDVTITCNKIVVGDVNWVTVSYASDHNRIRAFGLDITLTPADGNITAVVPLDPCGTKYRIYPGQIAINANGEVTDYNKPYDFADFNDANNNIAVEMGSLYTTDPCYAGDANAGFNKIPGLNGDLLKFGYIKATGYSVDVNVRRGGIVMEDPCETPSLDTPLCSSGGEEYKDFGDAPDTYKTLLASNGPRHLMATATTGIGAILGTLIDSEADGKPTPTCNGDDTAGLADEDGITLLSAVVNENGSVTVTVSNGPGKLDAWIDWNKNGTFDVPAEQVFNAQAVVNGPQVLAFAVPAGAVKNTLLVSRWRVSSAGGLTYDGPATNGEVEDYNNLTVQCHVPDCVGDVSATAQAKLIANGFTIGNIKTECSNSIPAGNVISTTPPFCTTGQCVAVDINVSTGSCECYAGQGDYAQWVEVNKPDCWCYPRQCHGDADGKAAGNSVIGYTYVDQPDLDIMTPGWKVKDPPKGSGILNLQVNGVPVACADFAHDKAGNSVIGYTRIDQTDLDRMITYWKVKEPPKGSGTPANCPPGNRTPP